VGADHAQPSAGHPDAFQYASSTCHTWGVMGRTRRAAAVLPWVTSKVPFLPFAQEIDSDCKRVGVQLEVEGVMRYGSIPDDQAERFAGRIPMPWLLSDCCAVIAPCSTSNKFVERIGISWLRFEKCVS
jgi:hypothetical protein